MVRSAYWTLKETHPPSAPMENRGVLVAAVTVRFKQETPMTDFQSFRTLVLFDEL